MTRRKLQIKCALCGKKIISEEQSKAIEEKINGTGYTFDNPDYDVEKISASSCLIVVKKKRLITLS
jgi:hypothetical protein